MALIECGSCGKSVSGDLAVCPSCGADLSKVRNSAVETKKYLGSLEMISAVAALAGSVLFIYFYFEVRPGAAVLVSGALAFFGILGWTVSKIWNR